MSTDRSSRTRAALTVALVLFLFHGPAWAQEFDETFRFDAESLRVSNLIGAVDVEGHDGDGFEVLVEIRGADAAADLVEFETDEGRRARLAVRFPDEDRFVYPELGRGRVRMDRDGDDGGWSFFGGDRIEVRGRGDGLELWADVTIRVPRDAALSVRNGVGLVGATDVAADLDLGTRSGEIRAEGIDGALEADTGSGHVEVSGVTGDLYVDTGSGDVDARGVEGARVEIDTGSGGVTLIDARGERLLIDTGSGSVETDRLGFLEVTIDTGSGSVECTALEADELVVDTGSGSVEVELTRMGSGDFEIDTGSGSIRLVLPTDASAHVWAETSSGGVDLDVAQAVVRSKERDRIEFEVGGGAARVHLDTGSGGIRIASR